jgi:hypothetical protein
VLNKEERKLIEEYRSKERQDLNKAKTEKFKIQFSKTLVRLVLILTTIVTLSSVYVNLKNGCSLDTIVAECWGALKFICPTYFAKSFLETREEKRNESEMINNGI